jgi:hypothetical protein
VLEVVTAKDLVDWDAELRFLADGLGCLFKRPEPRVTFTLMVRAMLADVAKKNSWGLAEYAGLATPQKFEHLLNGAIKKGTKSVGVAPQHCGATGQAENCQCMVMLSYASVHGHAFLDREL